MNFNSLTSTLKSSLAGAVSAVAGSDAYRQTLEFSRDVASKTGEAVHQAAVGAKESLAQAAGVKTLLNYEVQRVQVASAGPGLGWRLFPATSKKLSVIPGQDTDVTVWILDKNSLKMTHAGRGSGKGIDAFVNMVKRDIHNLSKLRHPCFLQVLEPIEETRTQLVLVTEPVLGSAHNILHRFSDLPEAVPESYKQLAQLCEHEVKLGLLQLVEGLSFLGNEAGMVHRGISTETVLVTKNGSFKISGMAWALTLKQLDEGTSASFDYSDGGYDWWQKVIRPPLGFVAPELIDNCQSQSSGLPGLATSVGPPADIFSLAALMYQFVSGNELLLVNDDLGQYWYKVKNIGSVDIGALPGTLQQTVAQMASASAAARPTAKAVAQSPYFTDDVLLRALKFLDTMLQRDNLEKAGFVKDLSTFWKQFDKRVLTNKVLPPLLAELRTESLADVVVPLVLSIVAKQTEADFVNKTLPALEPLMALASGNVMLQLLRGLDSLRAHMPVASVDKSIIPLICRAFDSGKAPIQEEALRQSGKLTDSMEFRLLKSEILPRLHGMCLKTTISGVRCNSMVAMGKVVKRLDREEAVRIVETVGKVTRVDKSPGTVLTAMGVSREVSKFWGAELTATKILPIMIPLTMANLDQKAFATVITTVKEMLAVIESKRAQAPPSRPIAAIASSGGVPSSASTDAYSSWKPASTAAHPAPATPASAAVTSPSMAMAAAQKKAAEALPSWKSAQSSPSTGFAAASALPKATPSPSVAQPQAQGVDDMSWLGPKRTPRRPSQPAATLQKPPEGQTRADARLPQTSASSAGDPFAASTAIVSGGMASAFVPQPLGTSSGALPEDLFVGSAGALGMSNTPHPTGFSHLGAGMAGGGLFQGQQQVMGMGQGPLTGAYSGFGAQMNSNSTSNSSSMGMGRGMGISQQTPAPSDMFASMQPGEGMMGMAGPFACQGRDPFGTLASGSAVMPSHLTPQKPPGAAKGSLI